MGVCPSDLAISAVWLWVLGFPIRFHLGVVVSIFGPFTSILITARWYSVAEILILFFFFFLSFFSLSFVLF